MADSLKRSIANLQARIANLERQLSVGTRPFGTSSLGVDPELIIPAFDDASPRALIGTGSILAEGTGIQITKPANTPYLAIAASGTGVDHGLLTGLADDDHTQYALLAGRSGGQSLIGGTASGDDLTLTSTSNTANRGSIIIGSAAHTYTADTDMILRSAAISLDFASATGTFLTFAPTITYDQAGNVFGGYFVFDNNPTYTNPSTEANSPGPLISFFDRPVIRANSQAWTIASHDSFLSQPTLNRLTSGGPTVTSLYHFRASGGTIDTASTVTTRYGLYIDDMTVNGVLNTQVGVEILNLTAATTDIGFRNASTSVYTPLNTNVTAVGTTIRSDATYVTLTATASFTLTAAPTIADGQDGQLLIITNEDTVDTVTIQDQGTLASSNLRLGATTRALAPRDSIVLIYNSTIGDWVELVFNNVI